jgi:hypothetical protein
MKMCEGFMIPAMQASEGVPMVWFMLDMASNANNKPKHNPNQMQAQRHAAAEKICRPRVEAKRMVQAYVTMMARGTQLLHVQCLRACMLRVHRVGRAGIPNLKPEPAQKLPELDRAGSFP